MFYFEDCLVWMDFPAAMVQSNSKCIGLKLHSDVATWLSRKDGSLHRFWFVLTCFDLPKQEVNLQSPCFRLKRISACQYELWQYDSTLDTGQAKHSMPGIQVLYRHYHALAGFNQRYTQGILHQPGQFPAYSAPTSQYTSSWTAVYELPTIFKLQWSLL